MKQRIQLLTEPQQEISFNVKLLDETYATCDVKIRTLKDNTLSVNTKINGKINQTSFLVSNLMPLIVPYSIKGNLYFNDLAGNDNPNYLEFNTRFQLIYNEEYNTEIGFL